LIERGEERRGVGEEDLATLDAALGGWTPP
jgi:hypothetical protein